MIFFHVFSLQIETSLIAYFLMKSYWIIFQRNHRITSQLMNTCDRITTSIWAQLRVCGMRRIRIKVNWFMLYYIYDCLWTSLKNAWNFNYGLSAFWIHSIAEYSSLYAISFHFHLSNLNFLILENSSILFIICDTIESHKIIISIVWKRI